jgi:rhodanese-related sulfurtransferase
MIFKPRDACADAPSASPAPCVAVDELARLMDVSGAVVIVDVRSPEEFASGHVDGALNIPVDLLAARDEEIPRASKVVTVCGKGGGRSDRAVQLLRERGFTNVAAGRGGTTAWLQAQAAGGT